MEINGQKGFTEMYDATEIGDAIAQHLFRKEEATPERQQQYLKMAYPEVMAFFEKHDLKPTAENVKLNVDRLRTEAHIDEIQAGTYKPEKGKNHKKWIVLGILVVAVLGFYFYKKYRG